MATADPNAPVVTTVIFFFNRFQSLFEGDAKLFYVLRCGTKVTRGGPLTPDDLGQCDVELPISPEPPPAISITVQREDQRFTGACAVAPNEHKQVYILIDPVCTVEKVTEAIADSRQTMGGGTATKDGGSITAGGRLGIVNAEGPISTETTRDSDRVNLGTQRTGTVEREREVITGVKLSASVQAPTQVSERANDQRSIA